MIKKSFHEEFVFCGSFIFLISAVFLFAFSKSPFNPRAEKKEFSQLRKNFISGYKALQLPALYLSYIDNLRLIKSPAEVDRQMSFFKEMGKHLNSVQPNSLTEQEKIDFEQMHYEVNLNLERLSLEKKWIRTKHDSIPSTGLYSLPDGRKWYTYFLKKWIGDEVTPENIFQSGITEIERVKKHIDDIRLQTGMDEKQFYQFLDDSSFFTKDRKQIQAGFQKTKKEVLEHLAELFLPYSFPDVEIKRGTNAQLSQTPGFYNENTFYYNLFDKPYNKRQFDWLFLHEAIPGHHFQVSVRTKVKESDLQKLFNYAGFAEGWAAYVEEYGKQLGVYQTPYDELGKWEWDIVRSVRVPLDIGLNYFGWSDEKALEFWKRYIPNQDDIAIREINRMKRWPCQVVTYKYGAAKFLSWKQRQEKKQGKNFDIRAFHDKILSSAGLPFFLIEKKLFSEISN